MDNITFGTADYVIFSLMLAFSAGIGVYYRFTGGKQKTSKEFLLADRNMSIIPVGFSLMASFMSAISLLGVSSEIYSFGTQFVVINISYIIGTPIAAFLFLPVFFQMDLTSAFQYLEQRFGVATRLIVSLTFMIQMILYMAIVLYAPALALSAVTGLSLWSCIISIGIVCTFYCTLGGIKAVLWTDVFQSILMFAAMYAVIIKGTIDVGGLGEVWRISQEGKRIEFLNFDPDPTVRHSVWTLTIGGIFVYVSIYAVNQTQVQRLLTVNSLKKAQQALFVNLPITAFLSLTTSFTGLVIYANFYKCDPLSDSKIKSSDQLLPYFVMKSLGHLSGLPGLFVAGIFSGALSTMSSAINSLAAVTLEDYIKRFYYKNHISEKKAAIISTVLACFYGMLCIALTYVAAQLGGVLQASLTIFGVVGGPILGLFSLGMFCKRANQKGAIIGLLAALMICFIIGFGSSKYPPTKLPMRTDGCSLNNTINVESTVVNNNFTISIFANDTVSTIAPSEDKSSDVFVLYKISYMWFAGLGWILAFVIGIIISFVTGGAKNVSSTLLSPIVRGKDKCEQSGITLKDNEQLFLDVVANETDYNGEKVKLTINRSDKRNEQ
ncbi:putative sodium-dependent multivitamin transporter [Centruroides vittatus]|uniref:putative sodium-dependent multivitamin transporter n=1 Tax=Centruroides vittatus TaxID=120091 RepID=UPI0035101DF8